MEPYYYFIEDNIISAEAKEYAKNWATDNKDMFNSYIMKGLNIPDNNNYLNWTDIHTSEEIKSLHERCSFKILVYLIMHKPNHTVATHKDSSYLRTSIISIPLLPEKDYAETNFFNEDKEMVATANLGNMQPAILNTQIFHNVVNNDNYRFNLQLCFEETFETVVEKYKSKELFDFQ
jgi:hypothetical protein